MYKKFILLFCASLLSVAGFAQTYQELIERGLSQLEQKKLTEAEFSFREAIKVSPVAKGNALLLKHIGQIQEKTGRQREAIETYSQAIALSPEILDLYMNRATLYMLLENDSHALSDFSTVLEINPDHTEALFYRAFLYSSKRDFNHSRDDYEHLLRLQPTNEKALIGLAVLNDKSGRPKEAMEQINNIILFFPNHGMGYAIRGGMEQRKREYEKALADYNQAIELEPENPDYYVSRGSLFLDMKKKKLAKESLRKALSLGADQQQLSELLLRCQ